MGWFCWVVLGFYCLIVLGRSVVVVRDYVVRRISGKKLSPLWLVLVFSFPLVFLYTFVVFPFRLGLKS